MSKANDIIDEMVSTIAAIQDQGSAVFKKVIKSWPTEDQVKSMPLNSFPCAAVVGTLPNPTRYIRKPDSRDGLSHLWMADIEFTVNCFIYAQETDSPIEEALRLMSFLWQGLLSDLTRGGKAKDTELYPLGLSFEIPLLVFGVEARIKYQADHQSL